MRFTHLLALAAAIGLASPASAAFLVEPNGLAAGNFSYGGNTTTASNSIPSNAVGVTAANSIFGGDAPSGGTTPDPDTYVTTYTPGVDGDNAAIAQGTQLNNDGNFATGLPAGGSGLYSVYVTWPFTTNISAGNSPTNWVLDDGTSDILTVSIDQNGQGHEWIKLGDVVLDAALTYTLTQTNTPNFTPGVPGFSDDSYTNGFVSQRLHGTLFVPAPEPTSAVMAAIAAIGFAARRRG